MATVSSTGIAPRDLSGYKQLLEDEFQSEFGATLSVDPETPAGQIISVAAIMLAESDEALVSLANSFSVGHAAGVQLDDLGTLLHIDRKGATYSRVTATLGGASGTIVASGSRAKSQDGDEWALTADATIAASGTVDGVFQAVDSGPVIALAGQLDSIVTLVSGWETVTNAADSTIGIDAETDHDFRNRYRNLTAQNAVAPRDALTAALYNAGADRVRLEVNDTSAAVTRQTLSIAARGIMAIVKGGTQSDIADAVFNHKPIGVAMSGNTSVTGSGTYQTVEEIALAVAITTSVTSMFPADGAAQMKRNLVAYAAGDWEGATGQFDTSGFGIGEDVDANRLRTPAYAVPGHTISAMTVTIQSSGASLPSTTPLNRLYTLAEAHITVTITTP